MNERVTYYINISPHILPMTSTPPSSELNRVELYCRWFERDKNVLPNMETDVYFEIQSRAYAVHLLDMQYTHTVSHEHTRMLYNVS